MSILLWQVRGDGWFGVDHFIPIFLTIHNYMKKNCILFFIDGLGTGKYSDSNPFTRFNSKYFNFFTDRDTFPYSSMSSLVYLLDAVMGVEGIPQSATGQASLFTGKNAQKLIGAHLFGFPESKLRTLLMKDNILKWANSNVGKSVFFNSYMNHSNLVNSGVISIEENGKVRITSDNKEIKRISRYLSVTTVIGFSTGNPFFGVRDILNGESLYHDFSNSVLIEKGVELPLISPKAAGKVLAAAGAQYRLTIYEYFMTDRAGHKKDMERSVRILKELDEMIGAVADNLGEDTVLIITSDHGNIEDLSTTAHTRNPVPLIIINYDLPGRVPENISDVYGIIQGVLG